MAWMKKNVGNPFADLAAGFEKMPNSVGNMHAPARALHPKTMMPGTPIDTGSTKGTPGGLGNPMAGALGGKSVQSPAQHQATIKAAQASAQKRKRIL
jgi:hypothetical protein